MNSYRFDDLRLCTGIDGRPERRVADRRVDRRRAKAHGKSLGRPFNLADHQKAEAIRRREAGEEKLAEIGRSHNMSGAVISRLSA